MCPCGVGSITGWKIGDVGDPIVDPLRFLEDLLR